MTTKIRTEKVSTRWLVENEVAQLAANRDSTPFSVKDMAARVERSETQVRRAINELLDRGGLHVADRHTWRATPQRDPLADAIVAVLGALNGAGHEPGGDALRAFETIVEAAERGAKRTRTTRKGGARRQAILDFLRDHPGAGLAEILAAVPRFSDDEAKDRHATADAVFRMASYDGALVKDGRGKTATYRLAEEVAS